VSSDNFAMPLRMIEIYTDTLTYATTAETVSNDIVRDIVLHIIRRGESVRLLSVSSTSKH